MLCEATYGSSFALRDSTLFAAVPHGDVHSSEDWGANWTALDFPDPTVLNPLGNDQVFADPVTEQLYVFGLDRFYRLGEVGWEVLRSYDYPPPDNTMIPGDPPTLISLDRDQGWFSLHQVIVSTDRGESWYPLGLDLPYGSQFTDLHQIEYDRWRHRVWLSTPLGLVYLDADELAVADPGATIRAMPLDYELLMSWPNPFNHRAAVRIHILQSGPVDLGLYDVQGRLVRRLLHETHARAGSRELTLSGQGLASGSYYLRMIQGDREPVSRKVIHVK